MIAVQTECLLKMSWEENTWDNNIKISWERNGAWESHPEEMNMEFFESRKQCWAYVNMAMCTQIPLPEDLFISRIKQFLITKTPNSGISCTS